MVSNRASDEIPAAHRDLVEAWATCLSHAHRAMEHDRLARLALPSGDAPAD